MTHDVDADGRPAQSRSIRNSPAQGTVTSDRSIPQAAEDPSALRLRALQPPRGTTHPARSDQALHGAVPLADLPGAAPSAGGPDAGRRTAALPGPARLAAAAGALDQARLRRVRLPARPRHGHAGLDRSDRVLPLHERPVERARHPGRPRPHPGGARDRHQSRLPHLLRARQGTAGDGDEDPGGRGATAPPRAAARVAARRGRRPGREGGLRAAGRAPLLPQGHREVEPAQGPAPRQDQARQLQRLAGRPRRRLRLLRLGRHRPHPAAQLPGADARLLPRPEHRLRHRPPGVRQLRQLRHQGRRVPAVPVPRADPARRQPVRRPHVRRHLQRRTDQGAQADRRAVRLHHRGHGDRFRDPPSQEPGDGEEMALGVHTGRARGG